MRVSSSVAEESLTWGVSFVPLKLTWGCTNYGAAQGVTIASPKTLPSHSSAVECLDHV